MKPNKLLHGRFRPLAGLLLRVVTLGVLAVSAPALAAPPAPPPQPVLAVPTLFPDLNEGQYCMGDVAGKLNCTANDVAITEVKPVGVKDANGNYILDGNGDRVMPVCNEEGETVTFIGDVTIATTASERYDTTFYLPLSEFSAADSGHGQVCGILLPVAPPTTAPNVDPYKAYVKIDGDQCGDITKSAGPNSYTVHEQEITMFCKRSPIDETRALFEYCAAWDNKVGDNNCKGTSGGTTTDYAGTAPGTPSKCSCAGITIDVFFPPQAAPINKTVDEPTSRPEPGGEFTYHVSFTNDSEGTLVVTNLKDVIDVGGDGSYDQTIDLWNDPLQVPPVPDADGIYLMSRSDSCMPTGTPAVVQLAAGGTFSCDFTLHIKDTDLNLPDEPTDIESVKYRDFVQAEFADTNGDPVGPPETDLCPAGYSGAGLNCSEVREVEITDEPPVIGKRFDLKAVAFVRVTNDGDEPLTVTGMKFKGVDVTDGANDGDLNTIPPTLRSFTLFNQSAFFSTHEANVGPFSFCTTGGTIAVGGAYNCAFTLEFPPGLVTEGPINFSVGNPDYLEVTVEDDDGRSATYNVSIAITTIE